MNFADMYKYSVIIEDYKLDAMGNADPWVGQGSIEIEQDVFNIRV